MVVGQATNNGSKAKKAELFADLIDANRIVGNGTGDCYFIAYKLGYFLWIADCIDFVAYY